VTGLSAGLFLVTRSLADGVRLFATALVIGVVTGVPTAWATLVVGAVMIVYTVRGGVAAVIWTDVVQMFVYVAGATAVAVQLLGLIPGGWDEVVRTGMAAGKFTIWDLSTDPSTIYTLWTGLVGGVALTLATHGTDQFLVQRLLAATSARAAATGLVLSGVIVFVQFTLFLCIGVMLFTFYQQTPLPPPPPTTRSPALRRHVVPARRRSSRPSWRRRCRPRSTRRRDDGQRFYLESAAGRRSRR
jgi:Na+/proline symporter